jgi:hypothetical protein
MVYSPPNRNLKENNLLQLFSNKRRKFRFWKYKSEKTDYRSLNLDKQILEQEMGKDQNK